jgi:hypothetical protein
MVKLMRKIPGYTVYSEKCVLDHGQLKIKVIKTFSETIDHLNKEIINLIFPNKTTVKVNFIFVFA